MKILFTGASSFTGLWFVRELAAAGHEVVATFRAESLQYADPLRATRVALLSNSCRPVPGCAFGDENFLRAIREHGPWDLLCHHAADVTDYKSPDFNVVGAIRNNTHNLPAVLDALAAVGCRRVCLTGSFFENDEGAGSQGLPAFSAYGLSKGLTAQLFRYYVANRGMGLGKFVIPNPFGPYEEPRFPAYLIRTWKQGKTPTVSTPAYVRDNIHVTILAKAYGRFVEKVPESGDYRFNPSGYVESQGAFARRFAAEMAPRLGIDCPVELKVQTDFSEPKVRVNTDVLDAAALGWDEAKAWDEIASYYKGMPA